MWYSSYGVHAPIFCFVTKVNDNPKNSSKCTLNDFRFFEKINDSLGNRWFLRSVYSFSPCFDCFEPHITPCYTPYRFLLPSKTAYYLHLGIIMHPNFDCIKIGVLIWLKTLILIQCTLWLNRRCIFVWAKSYRFRLKIGKGVNCSM